MKNSLSESRTDGEVFQILAGVSIKVEEAKNSLQGEIEARAVAVREEEKEKAAELARQVHEINNAKQAKLHQVIRALRLDLRVSTNMNVSS